MEESSPYLVTAVPAVIPALAKLPAYVPDAERPEITPPVIAPPMVRFVVMAVSILKLALVKF